MATIIRNNANLIMTTLLLMHSYQINADQGKDGEKLEKINDSYFILVVDPKVRKSVGRLLTYDNVTSKDQTNSSSSAAQQEEARRWHRIKHKTTKLNTVNPSGENADEQTTLIPKQNYESDEAHKDNSEERIRKRKVKKDNSVEPDQESKVKSKNSEEHVQERKEKKNHEERNRKRKEKFKNSVERARHRKEKKKKNEERALDRKESDHEQQENDRQEKQIRAKESNSAEHKVMIDTTKKYNLRSKFFFNGKPNAKEKTLGFAERNKDDSKDDDISAIDEKKKISYIPLREKIRQKKITASKQPPAHTPAEERPNRLIQQTKKKDDVITGNAERESDIEETPTKPTKPMDYTNKFRLRAKSRNELNDLPKSYAAKHDNRAPKLHINLNADEREKIYSELLRNRNRDLNIGDPRDNQMSKLKLRSKSRNHDNAHSTRMPDAFELHESETQPPPYQTTPNRTVVTRENLSPYAIVHQMRRLANECFKKNTANITVEIIGRTVEYNNIVLLKMTAARKQGDAFFRSRDNKYIDDVPEKKIVFIVHGLTVMGMNHLINDEDDFKVLLNIYIKQLDRFDILLIPMANPDGYAATVNNMADQYWNKNMAPQSACHGVALDRNFDVAWNESHKISSCSPTYPGPHPFSEEETRAVRDVFHKYGHKIQGYIHVHASTFDPKIFKGDAILYPRGYTETQTDDDKYIDLRGEVDEAMKNASFQVITVTVDTLYDWYGRVTGSSVDYAATVYGIPYAMEFAMQIYDFLQHDALEQIWCRLVHVVFRNIWKSLTTINEVDSK